MKKWNLLRCPIYMFILKIKSMRFLSCNLFLVISLDSQYSPHNKAFITIVLTNILQYTNKIVMYFKSPKTKLIITSKPVPRPFKLWYFLGIPSSLCPSDPWLIALSSLLSHIVSNYSTFPLSGDQVPAHRHCPTRPTSDLHQVPVWDADASASRSRTSSLTGAALPKDEKVPSRRLQTTRVLIMINVNNSAWHTNAIKGLQLQLSCERAGPEPVWRSPTTADRAMEPRNPQEAKNPKHQVQLRRGQHPHLSSCRVCEYLCAARWACVRVR